MKEQNWYPTSIKMCQRYSETKFKSEIPKFSQKSKKKKRHKTVIEKLGFCLILTLNKIKTSWSLKKPLAVSKWGHRWDEVKLKEWGEEEAIWDGERGSTRERERIWSWERPTNFSFFFFFGFYILTKSTGNRFRTKLKSTVIIKITPINGLDLVGYRTH